MTHIVAGYPDMKTCEEVANLMIDKGVSFMEIQIPFSDPVADGKTIMAANQMSLDSGTDTEDCFELMKKLTSQSNIPILFMSYFNVLFAYGLEEFCKKAKEIGCYGLIVPDIPLDEEEYDHYLEICKKYDLKAIQVVSPISTDERLKKISEVAEGFVYCVSRFGTTGAQSELNEKLEEYLIRVKKFIKVPLAVGFGISDKEQAEYVSSLADIVVIGSKVINLLDEKGQSGVEEFLEEILG